MSEQDFLEQVEQNKGIILKLVSLYANDAEEKKDLYQEILLQAWKGSKSYRSDAKFSTWLYRVSLNTILTQRRKTSVIDYNDSIDHYSDRYQSDSTTVAIEAKSLRTAIRQLAETDRAIISLHLDGYANPEIASIIGINNNHVGVKLHRIKNQLSTILKQER